MSDKTPLYTGTLTNGCTCVVIDDEGNEVLDKDGDTIPREWCDGFCWESALEDFANCIEHLTNREDSRWLVQGVRLWDRSVSGVFFAKKVSDIVRGMTVDSEWIMRYEVFSNRVEYSLSHHDAPTGSASVLTPIGDEMEVFCLE